MIEESVSNGYYDSFPNITPDEAKYRLQHLNTSQSILDNQIQQICEDYKKLQTDPVPMLYQCNGDAVDQEYDRICHQAGISQRSLQNELVVMNKELLVYSRLAICLRKMPAEVYSLLQTLVDGIPVKAVCLNMGISRKTYSIQMKNSLDLLCRIYNSSLDNVALSLQPVCRIHKPVKQSHPSGESSESGETHQTTIEEFLE